MTRSAFIVLLAFGFSHNIFAKDLVIGEFSCTGKTGPGENGNFATVTLKENNWIEIKVFTGETWSGFAHVRTYAGTPDLFFLSAGSMSIRFELQKDLAALEYLHYPRATCIRSAN